MNLPKENRPHVPEVRLEDVKLTPDFERVRAAYREKYGSEGDAFLRRDDYARWSYVAERIRHRTSLLDIGVGVGQFVNAMAARGTFERLVGVDVRKHTKFLRLESGFAMDYVSIAELPYRDGEFDVVTCMEVIEHLPEAIFAEGVRQLRRVCGKQLIVTVPFREEKLSTGHVRRFDYPDLEALFPQGKITLFLREGKAKGRMTYWALVEENAEPRSGS